MPRRLKLILVSLAALIAIVVLVGAYLLDDGALPGDRPFSVDLDEVRLLATAAPADLPLKINGILVGENTSPRLAIVAGSLDTTETVMARTAYQVIYGDSTVLIDAGMDRELHENFQEGAPYFPENYEIVQQAMRAASVIVVTHEHADHIGGIVRSPYLDEIAPKTALTIEQLDGVVYKPQMPALALPEVDAAKFGQIDYEGAYPVAPGIVLIKAPGHTPGSQMVYVQLQNGTEYLFVGDVAWNMANIRTITSRPRLVASLFIKEDRTSVLGQLAWLSEIYNKNELILVVSHDSGQFHDQTAKGILGDGFQISAAVGPPE